MRPFIALFLLFLSIGTHAVEPAAIILKSEETLTVLSEKKIRHSESGKIEVLGKAGLHHAELVFTENEFRRMRKYDVSVFDGAGRLIKMYDRDFFSERMYLSSLIEYDDIRVFELDVAPGSYPFTIEYEYEVQHDFMFGFSWYDKASESTKVLNQDLTLVYPESMGVMTYFDETTVEHGKKTEGENTAHFFKLDSSTAKPFEAYSAPADERGVQVVFQTFSLYKAKGSMESWESFGRWMNALWQGRDDLGTSAIEMVYPDGANGLSQEEKARRAYRYIQRNMRYVAILYGSGGFRTMDANESFKKGYGDCKALSNLMKSILAKVGVESYPALVSSVPYRAKAYPDRPANVFNHVILCIPIDGDTLWTECTSNRMPFNFLSDFTDDRYVMLMTPEGGKLARTPKYDFSENFCRRKINMDLKPDGGVLIDYEGIFQNLAVENTPFYNKEIYGGDDKDVLASAWRLKSFDVDELTVDLYPEEKPVMKVKAVVSNRVFSRRMGSKLLVSPFFFNERVPSFERESRENDIWIRHGFSTSDTIVIHLPEGASLGSAVDKISLDTAYGSFVLNGEYSEDESSLIIYRSLVYKSGHFSKDDYAEIKVFFDAVNRASDIVMVVEF